MSSNWNSDSAIPIDKCRHRYRVPVEEILDLRAVVKTPQLAVPVILMDVDTAEAKIRFPHSVVRELTEELDSVALEILCRDNRFMIHGALRHRRSGHVGATKPKHTALFSCRPDCERAWCTIVYWLQVEWLKVLQRLELAAEQQDVELHHGSY
jgi:hypothetical protein